MERLLPRSRSLSSPDRTSIRAAHLSLSTLELRAQQLMLPRQQRYRIPSRFFLRLFPTLLRPPLIRFLRQRSRPPRRLHLLEQTVRTNRSQLVPSVGSSFPLLSEVCPVTESFFASSCDSVFDTSRAHPPHSGRVLSPTTHPEMARAPKEFPTCIGRGEPQQSIYTK